MPIYNVEIKETLSRIITVNAEDDSEAITKAKERYHEGIVVLDEDDLVTTEFEIYDE